MMYLDSMGGKPHATNLFQPYWVPLIPLFGYIFAAQLSMTSILKVKFIGRRSSTNSTSRIQCPFHL